MATNQFLTDLYHGEVPDEELAKQADAAMVAEVLQANGLTIDDLAEMDEEQFTDLYNQAIDLSDDEESGEGDGTIPPGLDMEEADKEAQMDLLHVDFQGRQLAHAYVDEMNKMAASGLIDERVIKYAQAVELLKEAAEEEPPAKEMTPEEEAEAKAKADAKKKKEAKEEPKEEEKSASAVMAREYPHLFKIAEARACRFLVENNIDPATGKYMNSTEKTAAMMVGGQENPMTEAMDITVANAAAEILKEAGYGELLAD